MHISTTPTLTPTKAAPEPARPVAPPPPGHTHGEEPHASSERRSGPPPRADPAKGNLLNTYL